MSCGNVITRTRGDTFPEVIQIVDKDTREPLDITGNTFKLTVSTEKKPINEDNQQFQIIGVIVEALIGKVGFTPTTGNAAITGNMFFDVEMTDSGVIETVMNSSYNVGQDITKS